MMLRPSVSFTAHVAILFLSVSTVASAQERRPLILEGTETIYERVLTRPGAKRYNSDGGTATDEMYPAFQPMYVFARKGEYVEVGPSPTAGPEGWIRTEDSVLWKQNIVGSFTNSAGRSRQLLFETQDDLNWLLNHEALVQVQERLVNQADTGLLDDDSGVVSVEPQEFVNIQKELYLMPILDFTETLHPLSYDSILQMQVASVPLEVPEEDVEVRSDPFDVGIVFVLDTTLSMQPYIERTQRVLQNTISDIADNRDVVEKVNFGIIGFRDNPDAVPELVYRTKTLAGLERRLDESPVLEAIDQAVEVAAVNSPGFNEDSLAGVEDAIDTIDWDQLESDNDPINAKFIILVTDAGPKGPGDGNARSEIGPAELQLDAEGRGIAIMTLHLTTPSGLGNHGYASSQYRELSRFDGKTYYYPIENGSEDVFEREANRLVSALTNLTREKKSEHTKEPDGAESEDIVELGLAMKLAWLGQQQGTQAPDIIEGWVSNLAVENPQRLAIEPRLLVTKSELSTMANILSDLIQYGESAQSSEEAMDFFRNVQGLIADMVQNPDLLVSADSQTLGEALEFLDRLPYRSQILDMTENRWAQSAMIRRSIIDGMRQKLTQYEKWLTDRSVWTELYEGSPDDDYVFAMPFDVLP